MKFLKSFLSEEEFNEIKEVVEQLVKEEFFKLQKEWANKIDEHNKISAEKIQNQAMAQIERDAMWERHAHLVEAYMDNMNKILEKKL